MAETKKDKLEWAYRALEISRDASRRTIEEAYRNLRKARDPERFKGDARRQAWAIAQLKRLEEAYLALKEQATPKNSLVEDWYRQPKHKQTGAPPVPVRKTEDEGEKDSGASLVEAIFAGRGADPAKRFPAWLIVPAVVVVIILGSLLVHRPADSPLPIEDPGLVRDAALPDPTALAVEDPDPGQDAVPLPSDPDPEREAPPVAGPAEAPPRETASPPPVPVKQAAKPSPPKSVAGEAMAPEEKPKLVRAAEVLSEEAQREAFDLLVQKSLTAHDLVSGNIEFLSYREWQATPRDAGQFFVHLLAEINETGQPVQLIWAVDTKRQTARAMSQAARDLEAARNR
jgi:hypothetical protein